MAEEKPEKSDVSKIAHLAFGAMLMGLGAACVVSMITLGQAEGVTWAWWQIIMASMIATVGLCVFVVLAFVAWVASEF